MFNQTSYYRQFTLIFDALKFNLHMAKLSVNINKLALIRNSRGGNNPNVINWAVNCEKFGAEGITIHPRPDERHIRYADAIALKEVVSTEFNIEGNPKEQKFIDLVLTTKPTQVTLVPDTTNQLTSDHGWDTLAEKDFLTDIIALFNSHQIRTSIFVDPIPTMVEGALKVGSNRIELYTESYAQQYPLDKVKAIAPFKLAAKVAEEIGIGLNAGHDLSLENLRYFAQEIPNLLEVSIGHALVCDALIYGMENTIGLYKRQLSFIS
jgi:pyridoxine 5-phosphate synthase